MSRGRVNVAVLLAVCGGLSAAGGTVSPWVRFEIARDVGGVPVTEVETITGMALAPRILPVGLAAVAAAVALLVTRGRVQQAVAALLVVAGLVTAVLVTAGVVEAPDDGTLGAGVAFAGLGALATVAGGALALRPARPATLPSRYDLDAEADDDEWRLASDEDDEQGDA